MFNKTSCGKTTSEEHVVYMPSIVFSFFLWLSAELILLFPTRFLEYYKVVIELGGSFTTRLAERIHLVPLLSKIAPLSNFLSRFSVILLVLYLLLSYFWERLRIKFTLKNSYLVGLTILVLTFIVTSVFYYLLYSSVSVVVK